MYFLFQCFLILCAGCIYDDRVEHCGDRDCDHYDDRCDIDRNDDEGDVVIEACGDVQSQASSKNSYFEMKPSISYLEVIAYFNS